MISTATPRQIAGKIRSALNRGSCPKCHRPFDDGVFTFGLSGSDPRWYPSEEAARHQTPTPRYIVPVHETEVTLGDVLALMQAQQDVLDQWVEVIEREREERRMARELREEDASYGTASSVRCFSCGYRKDKPADCCERCGDDPVPVGIDRHTFNREHGYRD